MPIVSVNMSEHQPPKQELVVTFMVAVVALSYILDSPSILRKFIHDHDWLEPAVNITDDLEATREALHHYLWHHLM